MPLNRFDMTEARQQKNMRVLNWGYMAVTILQQEIV